MKATLRTQTVKTGDDTEEKIPVFRLEIHGWFDIMRFVPQMLNMQSEFAATGERILTGVKRRWGKPKFEQNMRYLWGTQGEQWARFIPSRRRRSEP